MLRLKKLITIVCVSFFASCAIMTSAETKPKLKVASDGFPAGHDTPEGVASDLTRALVRHDTTLFSETCIGLYSQGESRTAYHNFMRASIEKMQQEAKQQAAGIRPSSSSPKLILKVFAARHLHRNGSASYGYVSFNFQDVMFVDVRVQLYGGKSTRHRILVIQEPDSKWHAHPAPNISPLLSSGLDDETESVTDFSEVYEVQK